MIHALFIICFGVGAGFVILSFIFGEALGHLFGGSTSGTDGADFDMTVDAGGLDTDMDVDIDVGGLDAGADVDIDIGGVDTGADLDMDVGGHFHGHGVSPFKPMIIATFLTVFGGAGLILDIRLLSWIALPAALALGLFAGFLLLRFVYVPLYKYQSRGVVEKQKLIGLHAMVTEPIPQGGYGKIKYSTSDGNSYNAPAKSEDSTPILRGSAVRITFIEKNTFFVKVK